MLASVVPWQPAMSDALFTPERAEAAALRHWAAQDARRLAHAVARGRYREKDAQAELATTLAWHAQHAGIRSVSCRTLASVMLTEALETLEEHHNAVRASMIDAAEKCLLADPSDRLAAAEAAAAIARTENVPLDLIDAAFNIALWRTRRRA
jgi:hypothetical protein